MLIAIHGVKLYAQCHTRSEAICSLLYMEGSFNLNTTHGMKLYAQCYTRSEAIGCILNAIQEVKL